MSSDIGIKELSQRTSLNTSFIRKCLNHLKPIFEPHLKRGDSNSILFDNNAVAIFDQIKGYKENDYNLPQIKKLLEKSLNSSNQEGEKPTQTSRANPNQTTNQTSQTQNLDFQTFLDRLEKNQEARLNDHKKHEQELKDHRETMRQLENLKGEMKLLTQGRTPEEIKGEWENRQKAKVEIAKIVTELKKTSLLRPFKRRKLLAQLESLLDDEKGRGTEGKGD